MIFINEETDIVDKVHEKGFRTEKTKKFIKISIISILMIFLVAGGYFAYTQYEKEKTYLHATDLMNKGSYLEAEKIFSSLDGYKNAKEKAEKCTFEYGIFLLNSGAYEEAKVQFNKVPQQPEAAEEIMECDYQIALGCFAAKDYKNAKEIFASLGGYKDSAAKVIEIKKIIKYSNYKHSDCDMDAIEESVKHQFYRDWYCYGGDENIKIDEFTINGKEYGVESLLTSDGWCRLGYYFLGEEEKTIYLITNYMEEFSRFANEDIYSIEYEDMSAPEDVGLDYVFYSQPKEDIDYYIEQVELTRQQYSDDIVIQKTFEAFENRVSKEAYEKSPGHTVLAYAFFNADYADASVTYDSYSKTYICYMTGIFTENSFDVFGGSTSEYYVQAEFIDTGSALQMVDIFIN